MTRYYLDTEFIEDGKTIDLISIGIVCEDGRELYCQSVEFDASKADEWVQNNVLNQLVQCKHGSRFRHMPDGSCIGKYLREGCPWHTRLGLQDEILAFMDIEKYGKPEIWTYYGSYDHVAFCQLFGTMMELPKGFPMYTMDLKQWCKMLGDPQLPEQGKGEHNALLDARWNKQAWEFLNEKANNHS